MLIPLAAVHYERGNGLQAEALLRETVTLARRANMVDILWPACMHLAELLARSGRFDEAQTFARQSESVAAGFRSPMMHSIILAGYARICLLQRRLDDAVVWADDFERDVPPPYLAVSEYLTLARVRLAQDQPLAALAVLEQISARAQADGRRGHALEAAVLMAAALQRIDRIDAALDTLNSVLDIARGAGYVRLFVDAGPPILRLLRRIREQVTGDGYVAQLIEAFNADSQVVHPAEAVTERELDVLRLLAQGATNQEIVDALVISIGTVKSHINHIMTKLDARNRTEAVAKARSLGILGD
jgi:LuxR family maltose regulon positive regulatory protein